MSVQGVIATPRLDLAEAMYEYDPNAAQFIAPQILPVFNVPKMEANFSKITRESLLKRASTKRNGRGAFNRVDMYAEDASYKCKENGLEGPLFDQDRANYASEFDAEEATTYTIWMKLMMEMEVRVRDLVFNTTTWTGAPLYTSYAANPWDNIATDIIGQVLTSKEKVRLNTGVMPNALIVGAAQLANMLKNTGIKAQFPGAALITLDMIRQSLPAIFGLSRLIVGGQVYDSADEGQDFSGADIWGDDYAMVAVVADPGDRLVKPCLGRTFLWTPITPSIDMVEQYREEQITADIFRVRQYTDEEIFDPYYAHLMLVDA